MTFCGTPYWTAPEVIRQENYTLKADVFSYAIILWELVTGKEPYDGMEGLNVAYAVADDGLRPDVPNICPEGYPELLAECWSDDPEERPEFGKILERLQELGKMFSTQRPEALDENRKANLADLMMSKMNRAGLMQRASSI
mmetsp:Transcript_43719/g.137291  ORF Transcript_43719/g.137291 Transcript_43719/m.137291 type:complete len:141 (-) Transcript_43719:57-479(-)